MINDPNVLSVDDSVLEKHSYFELSDCRKPYYFKRNAFSQKECQEIWSYWNEDEVFTEDNVTSDSPWYKYFREERSRKHMFFDEPIEWLDKKIDWYTKRANAENFYLDISFGLMSRQLMYYRLGDWFQPHDDTGHWDNNYYDRKLTIIIQLSESTDYEGGNTTVEEYENIHQPKYQKDIGSILIFPTFAIHEVKEITKGFRKAFICWYSGPKFR